MRLNRFLAASGLGSRRSCEELIIAGRVTINGQVCQNFATEVTDEDFVKVGSKRVLPEKHIYILLHKPRGYLCTVADTHDRRTIFDLFPAQWPRMFHVGRLDLESEGLLILTNDGDLGLHLTHPRFKIEKEYEVLLDRPYNAAEDTARLLHGVHIEGGRAMADAVRQLGPNLIRITLRQGLKRQIRLMLFRLGYEVKRLIRIRIGPLRLTDIRAGEWRPLTDTEVKMLREAKPEPDRPKPPKPPKLKPHKSTKPAHGKSAPGKPVRTKFASGKPALANPTSGKPAPGNFKPAFAKSSSAKPSSRSKPAAKPSHPKRDENRPRSGGGKSTRSGGEPSRRGSDDSRPRGARRQPSSRSGPASTRRSGSGASAPRAARRP